ncbi:metallophosphoesterase [Candidatus Pacearchaeota archaeon]|nr:metallophosphoesterase [Candidatus Pacearchaeota archaeon]
MNHIFISKSVFFPEHGILAIGDLHVGYEQSLIESGILVPEMQVKEIIEDLRKIIEEIKNFGFRLKKIVFLGDIKHYFNYEWKEKFNFEKILDFLRQYVKDSNIILVKGNHDKFDFAGKKMKNYYFNKGIMFFHGHMDFQQINDERVETWVLGHLHPSVTLSDKANIKREKYKCFLTGKFKEKEIIIVPSFFGIIEGTPVNEDGYEREGFSIIPNSELKNFEVHAISDDGKTLNFGKVRKLMD